VLLQDIRYALRSLWHSKGFAVVSILCLGFGIGLNTTIFSIVDGVLLQPYPYDDPDRILVVGSQNPRTDGRAGLSYLDLRDWKAAGSSFTTIASVAGRSLTISDSGSEPERYLGAGISWDLFPMLGTEPILGSGFTEAHDQPNTGGVVILGYDLWTRRYQADPNIVGRTILVNARPHAVVGVMPKDFAFPNTQQLWIPLAPLVAKDPRDSRGLFSFGRLKLGVTKEQASSELSTIAERLAREYPATNEGWTVWLRDLREAFLPEEVPIVIALMMAAVTLVLFVACSNVANLLLARAAVRRREISIRAALGAGRGRIIRQLLTESVVLGLVSLPLGIGLAEVGTRLIESMMPPDQVPYYVKWQVDWRSLLYTLAIAVSTAIVFGLFPALQASRGNLHESLKEGTRGNTGSRSWLRSTLVVAQVSLALVSLVGALLFVRTFVNLDSVNFGFDVRPLMTMRFAMGGELYEQPDARLRRVQDVVLRIEALPGVAGAFASNWVPLSGGGGGGLVEVDGRPAEPTGPVGISFIGVTPGFLKAMNIRLLAGRDFTESEGYQRSAVAVVNQIMAKRLWPDGQAVGRRFRMTGGGNPAEWFTVIGIAADARLYGVDPSDEEPQRAAFVSYAYQQTLNTGLTVRTAGGDPAGITSAVRAELRNSDPNLALFQARTMDDVRRLSFWQYGLYGWVFGSIGVMGLLLASVGVYGVLSYSVSQRTQEIGVRVALGADRRQVLGLVVKHGLWLVGIGIVVGLGLALAGTPQARSLLFQVSPFDPISFAAVALLFVAVAFLASFLPARRATRVDPVVALRGE
jgi:putative ABC transport system permease protein